MSPFKALFTKLSATHPSPRVFSAHEAAGGRPGLGDLSPSPPGRPGLKHLAFSRQRGDLILRLLRQT